MSPSLVLWTYRIAVLLHVAAVVVWFGAVAYFLLILRPAMRMAGLERPARYALIQAVKRRLKRVVGSSIVVLIATGIYQARVRGLLGGTATASAFQRHVFYVKLALVLALVAIFLTALPLLRRVRTPALRGRLFVATHLIVLILGALAAGAGVLLSR